MTIDRTIGTASVDIKADTDQLRADLARAHEEVAAATAKISAAYSEAASRSVGEAQTHLDKFLQRADIEGSSAKERLKRTIDEVRVYAEDAANAAASSVGRIQTSINTPSSRSGLSGLAGQLSGATEGARKLLNAVGGVFGMFVRISGIVGLLAAGMKGVYDWIAKSKDEALELGKALSESSSRYYQIRRDTAGQILDQEISALDQLDEKRITLERARLARATTIAKSDAYLEERKEEQRLVEMGMNREEARTLRIGRVNDRERMLDKKHTLDMAELEKRITDERAKRSAQSIEENQRRMDASAAAFEKERDDAYQLFLDGVKYDTERAENQKKLNEQIAEDRAKREKQLAEIQIEAARRAAAYLQPVLDSLNDLFGQTGTDRIGVSAKYLASRIDALNRTTGSIRQAQAGIAQGVQPYGL